jgi:phosphoglycolate phosphatase
MKYKAVIFDLDGTVLDTIGDLAAAVNYALEQHHLPNHSVEDVRRMVGNGVANLIRRATPAEISDEKCAEILAVFKARYREHINDLTVPYEGVIDLLKALKNAGVYVGINSNKYDAALQSLCRIHFDGLYDYAVGESEVTPKKPDPTAAQRIMAAANALPSETIYIGDSNVDVLTAQNANIDSAWVSWGFRSREELGDMSVPNAFDSVAALTAFILE